MTQKSTIQKLAKLTGHREAFLRIALPEEQDRQTTFIKLNRTNRYKRTSAVAGMLMLAASYFTSAQAVLNNKDNLADSLEILHSSDLSTKTVQELDDDIEKLQQTFSGFKLPLILIMLAAGSGFVYRSQGAKLRRQTQHLAEDAVLQLDSRLNALTK